MLHTFSHFVILYKTTYLLQASYLINIISFYQFFFVLRDSLLNNPSLTSFELNHLPALEFANLLAKLNSCRLNVVCAPEMCFIYRQLTLLPPYNYIHEKLMLTVL